jgi:hypothetical protein
MSTGGEFRLTSPEEIEKQLEQQAEQELEAAPKDNDLLTNLDIDALSSNYNNNTSNFLASEFIGKNNLLKIVDSDSQSLGGEDRTSANSDDEPLAPEEDPTNEPSEVIPKFDKLSARSSSSPTISSMTPFGRLHEPNRAEVLNLSLNSIVNS